MTNREKQFEHSLMMIGDLWHSGMTPCFYVSDLKVRSHVLWVLTGWESFASLNCASITKVLLGSYKIRRTCIPVSAVRYKRPGVLTAQSVGYVNHRRCGLLSFARTQINRVVSRISLVIPLVQPHLTISNKEVFDHIQWDGMNEKAPALC